MSKRISLRSKKIGVVINYLSLLWFVALFYTGEHIIGWSTVLVAAILVSILIIIITFVTVHVNSGLWKLIHSKIEKLDEREIYVTHESLRYSYAIMSIILLLIIFVMALTSMGKDALGPILPAGLIYFAHTLPSSVIVWKEKDLLT
ncbi:MAG: hypothetical protein HN356_02860 [Calditrichaeota bacterium]|nr:hypothetical protein [Calditrichota bacterium]